MENNISNINFTGRCPQIREAQRICHIISAEFPHITPSMFTPVFDKFTSANTKKPKRIISINANNYILNKLTKARSEYRRSLMSTKAEDAVKYLQQLKNAQIGNCGEIAAATEVALRANGIKNATRAALNVDHVVCVFNRDGSEFDKIINNKTIIVDAWNGMVDFAGNMLKKYENMYRQYFYSPKNIKITIRRNEKFNLTEANMQNILRQFPEIKKSSK